MQREVVADVPTGTVCRFKGEWGVVGKVIRGRYRFFDRWHGRPILLKTSEIVEVPSGFAGR